MPCKISPIYKWAFFLAFLSANWVQVLARSVLVCLDSEPLCWMLNQAARLPLPTEAIYTARESAGWWSRQVERGRGSELFEWDENRATGTSRKFICVQCQAHTVLIFCCHEYSSPAASNRGSSCSGRAGRSPRGALACRPWHLGLSGGGEGEMLLALQTMSH